MLKRSANYQAFAGMTQKAAGGAKGVRCQRVKMTEIRALWQKIGFEVAWCSRLEI
ncbi:MAG: hypothetical protein PHX30_01475 [Candidatus Pacebacteria bacterium]|nr:hypothetical protein [Candidatus Paceibacterota bacterium]